MCIDCIRGLINDLLSKIGLRLVKLSTFNKLCAQENKQETPQPQEIIEQPKEPETTPVDEALKSSDESNKFRLQPKENEPTEIVPSAFLKTLLRESAALRTQGDELVRLRKTVELMSTGKDVPTFIPSQPISIRDEIYTPIYNFDGLRNDPYVIHNHDFMKDPRFMAAYKRAMQATELDQGYYWRVHVALWCASIGLALDGDFVECGVWKGLLSTSIATYFNWNETHRNFYLFDTFRGLDEQQVDDSELNNVSHFRIGFGEDIYDQVVKNFSEFKDIKVIRGSVPSTLTSVDISKVAYLSIDMNNATPEIAAINYYWDKLTPGAPILLDDYGFVRYEAQKKAFDEFASQHGIQVLALPTGQGLMIKPGNAGGK